ncbi:unnamed protein product [Victoria cruziana]
MAWSRGAHWAYVKENEQLLMEKHGTITINTLSQHLNESYPLLNGKHKHMWRMDASVFGRDWSIINGMLRILRTIWKHRIASLVPWSVFGMLYVRAHKAGALGLVEVENQLVEPHVMVNEVSDMKIQRGMLWATLHMLL